MGATVVPLTGFARWFLSLAPCTPFHCGPGIRLTGTPRPALPLSAIVTCRSGRPQLQSVGADVPALLLLEDPAQRRAWEVVAQPWCQLAGTVVAARPDIGAEDLADIGRALEPQVGGGGQQAVCAGVAGGGVLRP